MKNKKKQTRTCTISIVFYVLSVIFLGIAAFAIYQGYLTVQGYLQQYTMTFADIIGIYFSSCAQYFAYAFILYGLGNGLARLHVLNTTLGACVEEDTEVEEEVIEEAISAA